MTSPNSAALGRIRAPGHAPAPLAGPPLAARRTVAVVTQDDTLADTVRRATPDRSVMVVATPFALADLLLQEHTAVLVLDAAVPGDHCAEVIDNLALQFPEMQMIAVGSRRDEVALTPALSAGRVYRFMHRPFSVARARTFIESALERYDGLQPAVGHGRIRRLATVGFAATTALLIVALASTLQPPARLARAAPPPAQVVLASRRPVAIVAAPARGPRVAVERRAPRQPEAPPTAAVPVQDTPF